MDHRDPHQRLASTICLFSRPSLSCLALAALVLVCFAPAAHARTKKYILMINGLGQSHPGPVLVTDRIFTALHLDQRFDVELHWDNLDAATRNVLEILGGKPPQEIPIVHGPSLYLFDCRELRRWSLDESQLPAGSTILFRAPAPWERHKGTLLASSIILLVISS